MLLFQLDAWKLYLFCQSTSFCFFLFFFNSYGSLRLTNGWFYLFRLDQKLRFSYFTKSLNILGPFCQVQLLIISELTVVKRFVLNFGVHNLLDQEINVLHFSKDTPLKHPEPFSRVKYLKSCNSPQHLHWLVSAIVNSVIRIFIKNIKNRNQKILA